MNAKFLMGFGTGVLVTIGTLSLAGYYAMKKGFMPMSGQPSEDLGKNPDDFEVEMPSDKKEDKKA